MTKWDKILITLIIVISLSLIGILTYNKSQAKVLYGVVEKNGQEQEAINLSEVDKPYLIKVENGEEYNVIQVEKGSIRIIEASCPDKDCIKIGRLDANGEVSVCLPNNVIIRVRSSGNEDDGIDSTTY